MKIIFLSLRQTIEPTQPVYARPPYPEELENVQEEEEHDASTALLNDTVSNPMIVPNNNEDYDRALEDINASIRNNRRKNSLASLRNDSKASIIEDTVRNGGGNKGMKKSTSHVALETRWVDTTLRSAIKRGEIVIITRTGLERFIKNPSFFF